MIIIIETSRIYKWEERVGIEREHNLSKSTPDLSRLATWSRTCLKQDFLCSFWFSTFSSFFISIFAFFELRVRKAGKIVRHFFKSSFSHSHLKSIKCNIANSNLSLDLKFWNQHTIVQSYIKIWGRCSDLAGNIPPVICCFAQFLIFTTSLLVVRPSQQFYLPILLS